MGRWIKIHSKIMKSAVWSDPLRLKAWIHILMSANYKDKQWFANGQAVTIKKGQFVTSTRKLQKEWGCSQKTVIRILGQFEEFGMIKVEHPQKRYSLLTVIKYGVYQSKGFSDDSSDDFTDDSSDDSSEGFSDDFSDDTQHKNIYKNNKKEKEYIEAAPPDGGGPDGKGEIPEGWTEKDEAEFQMMYEDNDWKTRAAWAAYWKDGEE